MNRWARIVIGRHRLHSVGVLFEPGLQFIERLTTMRDAVLLRLVHLGVRLALVFEARIPTYIITISHLETVKKRIGLEETYQKLSGREMGQSRPEKRQHAEVLVRSSQGDIHQYAPERRRVHGLDLHSKQMSLRPAPICLRIRPTSCAGLEGRAV